MNNNGRRPGPTFFLYCWAALLQLSFPATVLVVCVMNLVRLLSTAVLAERSPFCCDGALSCGGDLRHYSSSSSYYYDGMVRDGSLPYLLQ